MSGEITIDGVWAAWTLECPETKYPAPYHCIPAGTYKITLYPSPKFGRLMPLLMDVPGCPYPEIHYGNYPLNYEGCIGVGTMRSEDAIWNTREKFDVLFPRIEAAVKGEGCDIQILDLLAPEPQD